MYTGPGSGVPISDGQMAALDGQAAGLFHIQVILPEQRLALLMAGLAGDPVGERLGGAIMHIGRVHGALRPGVIALCRCCDRSLGTDPFTISVVCPASDDSTHQLVFPLCRDCAGTSATAAVAGREAFRKMRPDVKVVDITHADGGRA